MNNKLDKNFDIENYLSKKPRENFTFLDNILEDEKNNKIIPLLERYGFENVETNVREEENITFTVMFNYYNFSCKIVVDEENYIYGGIVSYNGENEILPQIKGKTCEHKNFESIVRQFFDELNQSEKLNQEYAAEKMERENQQHIDKNNRLRAIMLIVSGVLLLICSFLPGSENIAAVIMMAIVAIVSLVMGVMGLVSVNKNKNKKK